MSAHGMKPTFTDAGGYKAWRDEWRQLYTHLSQDIRESKHRIKSAQREGMATSSLMKEHRYKRIMAHKLMSAVARRARELGARELAITTGVENEVAQRFFNAVGAKKREAAVFMMSADGIEWLAAEGN